MKQLFCSTNAKFYDRSRIKKENKKKSFKTVLTKNKLRHYQFNSIILILRINVVSLKVNTNFQNKQTTNYYVD